MAPRFEGFKAAVESEVANRGWFRSMGIVPLVAGIVVFAAIGGIFAFVAIDGWRTYTRAGAMSCCSPSRLRRSSTPPCCSAR